MVKERDRFMIFLIQDNSHCPREEERVLIGQRVRESCLCPREEEEIVLIGQRFIALNRL